MGKAARNERRKLRATFYNNIASGLFLGGVFIPYVGVLPKAPAVARWIESGRALEADERGYAVGISVGILAAALGAWLFRRAANRIASAIED